MSTATWGEQEAQFDKIYPSSLLKRLLQQMMGQFAASGACIALYNESMNRMEMRLHLRVRGGNGNTTAANTRGTTSTDGAISTGRHPTIPLTGEPPAPAIGRLQRPSQPLSLDELIEEVSPLKCDLFPVGSTYPIRKDLVGYVWYKNEAYIMRHDDYVSFFYTGPQPFQTDVVPTCYLVAPVQESVLVDETRDKKKTPQLSGVIILYHTTPGAIFQQKQRADALNYAERIALHLENERLRLRERRTSDYLQQLQEISTAFPTTVQLATLVENVYQFATKVVDVSSMLITLYDRDTQKIYDIFALQDGERVEGITERPLVTSPEERPLWWKLIHEDKCKLLLEPAQVEKSDYDEILTGIWGDQRKTASFLILPMKMFNRVIGSLSLTSMRAHAYHPEEIQVLETMVQIITVSIENAKLYDRTRQALREAKEREELLAAMNSALQSISSVLNTAELLHKFVESATRLVRVEMSIFFQLTPDQQHLVAQAAYETPTTVYNEGRGLSVPIFNQENHNDLIEKIRLPFKGSILESLVSAGFFYLDKTMAEELAKISEEEGTIFLLETGIEKMLMIPVLYQTKLLGILGVHTPKENHNFRPADIGTLLAICAQAASALRNAQLFEETQEAYAEQQRLDKLKDEFLVTASHELRTPLSAISGYSTLLKRQSTRITPQQILRFATKITGAAQQLTDLVSSMTEAAKIGAVDKKLELQFGPVQLLSAVEMAINMLSVNIEQKISSQVAPDLWMNGDALRVRQVISNLLDNAAKYSPLDGNIEIIAVPTSLSEVQLPDDQIDVESDPRQPVVLVQVNDEGEGILPEDQQKIFEKFVRAPRSLTTPVRGSGLGLFICRRYIEAMGGRLWLQQSIPGEGSAFRFYLPRIDAPIEMSKNEQDEPAG